MRRNKHLFRLLGLATLVGLGGLGVVLVEFGHGIAIRELFEYGEPWPVQVQRGLFFGVVAGLLAAWLVEQPALAASKQVFRQLIDSLNVGWPDILFVSFCAGFGEELLFRAGLQPWLGVIPTAIIFVALHGYLNPRKGALLVYGLLMVVISSGLGFLFDDSGYVAAATAHFAVDVVLFARFRYANRTES